MSGSSTSTAVSSSYLPPRYTSAYDYTAKKSTEPSDIDAGFPGETDAVEDVVAIGMTVELVCPICQAPMTAVLAAQDYTRAGDLSVSSIRSQTYAIEYKYCDCPEIYFGYGKLK